MTKETEKKDGDLRCTHSAKIAVKVFDSIDKTFVFLMGSHLIHRFNVIIGHWQHDNGFQLYAEIQYKNIKKTTTTTLSRKPVN